MLSLEKAYFRSEWMHQDYKQLFLSSFTTAKVLVYILSYPQDGGELDQGTDEESIVEVEASHCQFQNRALFLLTLKEKYQRLH